MSDHVAKRVLLVDDSADFRTLVVRFFELLFPEDEIVEYDLKLGPPSGLFVWEEYDLLLLDYNLGGQLTGLDWLRRYQTSCEFPPTLMLTGEGNEEVAVKAFQYGAQDYLRKQGLTKTQLRESIEKVLERHEEDKDLINTIGLSNHIFNKSKFLSKLEGIGEKDLAFLIEIDNFQRLRDQYGMMSTDRLGAFVSHRVNKLLDSIGTTHSIIRIGDSSIAGIVSSYAKDDRGQQLAEAITNDMSARAYSEGEMRIEFTVSMGLVPNKEVNISIDTILSRLDDACLNARNVPGNTWHIYDTPEEISTAQDEALKQQIIDAFRNNRAVPNYQPLIRIVEAETALDALYMVRVSLRGDDENAISPLEFMPTIRNNNLKKSLDRWVIQRTLNTLKELSEKTPEHRQGFMITLTEDSLTDKDLPAWLKQLGDKLGVTHLMRSLIFKMPAEKFLKHEKKALFLMRHIRESLGVALALDNVTDASQFSTIARILKFDFLMFNPCVDGEEIVSQKEAERIVALAHDNQAFAVANKLECNEDLTKMIMAGVDFVSGHFIQAPQEDIVFTEVHEL